ncbi:MAG TPA: MFS transporter [Polyangiaceae bacterium]|jgi:PAT family beta-lactamase induction signal transducer AmpG|nr:MFS transporter [Polyangiaceae bacterium]
MSRLPVKPLKWVPSLYFAMGAPMITVSVVAAIMYKNLGVSNADIAFHTGFMYLPWALKPIWAPVVEMFRTKKFFVVTAEIVIAVTLGCVAMSLSLPHYMPWTIAFLWMTAFASATQDIAADGVYIASMSRRQQALYAGVQGVAWNIGRIIASGLLVSFTGKLHDDLGLGWHQAWMVVMAILAAIMIASAGWHGKVLPSGGNAAEAPTDIGEAARVFVDAFASFFKKKGIAGMIAFTFFYRFGEGLIEKIGPLFLLDDRAVGGLQLSNVDLGKINGTYGTLGFILGAILGGIFSARLGLRRSILALVLALNVPHVTYLFLSQARPTSLPIITAVVTIEKFGYGLGSVGHMLYMMQQVARGSYRTAHYAFATGIMGLCMMSTGMISGYISEAIGYQRFFIMVMMASALPILALWFAPFQDAEDQPQDFAPDGVPRVG